MTSSSITKRKDGTWRARYRGCTECPGKPKDHEHVKHFKRKTDGDAWRFAQVAKVQAGTHVSPAQARTTVNEWADIWLAGYAGRRQSSVRQAGHHLTRIRSFFGPMELGQVRPSHVKSWIVSMQGEELAASTIYVMHSRLAQLFSDAVLDGLLPTSPCSRRTSPPRGKQRPYVATTEQVWALVDAMPENLRPVVTLSSFAGLRLGEVCGLRVADVDFMRGIVTPTVQYPDAPLKTEKSHAPIPIPQEMALGLSAYVQKYSNDSGHLLVSEFGTQAAPSTVQGHFRVARKKVKGLPANFRHHDLRHYFASLLIASGADVKVVQARLRHASAMTTLDVYGHMWPDTEDATRTAVAAVWRRTPADNPRTGDTDS